MTARVTPDQRKTLLTKALEAKDAAYCPYSKFRVGACLLTSTGDFIKGCNVENASYGAGICAERTALTKGVSEGHKKFVAVAVASDLDEPCSPCGICRQFIREFCPLDTPILMVHTSWTPTADDKSKVLESTLDALLPHSFGPEHLTR